MKSHGLAFFVMLMASCLCVERSFRGRGAKGLDNDSTLGFVGELQEDIERSLDVLVNRSHDLGRDFDGYDAEIQREDALFKRKLDKLYSQSARINRKPRLSKANTRYARKPTNSTGSNRALQSLESRKPRTSQNTETPDLNAQDSPISGINTNSKEGFFKVNIDASFEVAKNRFISNSEETIEKILSSNAKLLKGEFNKILSKELQSARAHSN